MNFLVSQQIFPKLILSLQILVFYLQTFIGWRGPYKIKGAASLEAETSSTNHTQAHTLVYGA